MIRPPRDDDDDRDRGPEPGDDRLPTVPYVPFQCPKCGNFKPRTYGQNGRMRYHRCRFCRTEFRSLQVPADRVSGWQ